METNILQSQIAEIRRRLEEIESVFTVSPSGSAPGTVVLPSPQLGKELGGSLRALSDLCKALDSGSKDRGFTAPDLQEGISGGSELPGSILRSITDAVIAVDARGKAIFLNAAAEKLTGWSLAEAVGKPLAEITPLFEERDHSRPFDYHLDRTKGDTAQGFEQRALLRARDKKEHMVTIQGSRMTGQGQSPGTALVVRDISKSYFLEEEVLKIRKLESVGVLAGGIAHDFNNLLTGITTNLFMARMSVVGNNEASSLISEAEKAAFKATTLTKQLLSFARGGPSIKERSSIKQLVQDTVGFCLSGSNVDYRLDLPDDLPSVEIDKGQIDQVLNNLIMNAAQSMPDGGTVTIGAESVEITGTGALKTLPLQPGRYVKVWVKDEGTGISPEYLERIFDPYFSTREEKTGLGLSTSYSIIKRHGGHIYVESAKGKGSSFIFLLPVPEENGDAKNKTVGIMSKGTGKVLIMDDDMIVRTVVETLLKKAGYSPLCVANGEDALREYREAMGKNDPFTITIMDLTIPGGMGGKETIKRLREIDPGARVIVFSGYSNDPIFSNFKEFGFDGILSKPFSIEEFLKTIAMVLHERT
ncbi:MAG: response regulator [Chitinispirillaceae bacterium]|nr:response regulator [Chitinispirillaceae bacterium]